MHLRPITYASIALASLATALVSTPARASFIAGPNAVGAFYTPDDGYRHAVVAQTDGTVREVYYTESGAWGGPIAHFDGIAGIAGYYTPVDGNRHALVARTNGEVWEIWWNRTGIYTDLIGTVPAGDTTPIVSMSAWVDQNTHQHVAVATKSGNVYHLTFYPFVGGNELIGSVGDGVITGVSGFDRGWDGQNVVVVAVQSASGTTAMRTLSWPVSVQAPAWNQVTRLDAGFPGQGGIQEPVTSISAFWESGPWDGVDQVFYLTPQKHLKSFTFNPYSGGVNHDDWSFVYGPTPTSVAGFDGIAQSYANHAVVSMSNGDLWDMYADTSAGPWRYHYLGSF